MSRWIENSLAERFRADYENMQSSFIYGNPIDFDSLIRRIEELQERFHLLKV